MAEGDPVSRWHGRTICSNGCQPEAFVVPVSAAIGDWSRNVNIYFFTKCCVLMEMNHQRFRAKIAELGFTQIGLARRMKELGDDRTENSILRSIQRMITGDARVSGEMKALVGLLAEKQGIAEHDRKTGSSRYRL
jgi:hypothetical protein